MHPLKNKNFKFKYIYFFKIILQISKNYLFKINKITKKCLTLSCKVYIITDINHIYKLRIPSHESRIKSCF